MAFADPWAPKSSLFWVGRPYAFRDAVPDPGGFWGGACHPKMRKTLRRERGNWASGASPSGSHETWRVRGAEHVGSDHAPILIISYPTSSWGPDNFEESETWDDLWGGLRSIFVSKSFLGRP